MMFKAISHLFFGKRFEFYSPYSLTETYQRLQDLSERDKRKPSIWRRKRFYLFIKMETVDLGLFRFCADRDVGRNLIIIGNGTVRQDASGVHVKGVVRIGTFTLGFTAVWLIFWFAIWSQFTFVQDIMHIPLFGAVAISLLLIFCKQAQNKMYNQLHIALGKSKKKNHHV